MSDRWLFSAMPIVLVTIAALATGCDFEPGKAQTTRGGITNCVGPAFSRFSQSGQSGPGADRPVFKVNDELVLAIPKDHQPFSNELDSVPTQCHQISDLPQVHYLYFLIWGNWSTGYTPEDIPRDEKGKQFQPDVVSVRVELTTKDGPFGSPPLDVAATKSEDDSLLDKKQFGSVTCGFLLSVPHENQLSGRDCSGKRNSSEMETFRFRIRRNDSTQFHELDARYPSAHYGGVYIYWHVWTLDIARTPEIDQAIWKALADWNLIDKADGSDAAPQARRALP